MSLFNEELGHSHHPPWTPAADTLPLAALEAAGPAEGSLQWPRIRSSIKAEAAKRGGGARRGGEHGLSLTGWRVKARDSAASWKRAAAPLQTEATEDSPRVTGLGPAGQ